MNIPSSFSQIAQTFKHGGYLKEAKDQFGTLLETEIGEIFFTEEQIEREGTQYLLEFLNTFVPEDLPKEEKQTRLRTQKCFAIDGAGNPFCMDFSQTPAQPSVTYWDDGELAWRRVADSIAHFFALFLPED